jgi:hypothetical protein
MDEREKRDRKKIPAGTKDFSPLQKVKTRAAY